MTYVSKPTTSSKHPGTSSNHPGTVSQHPATSAGNHPGSSASPPAQPTLTAPANNANVFNGIAVTVSATSTDLDLDRMDWVIDPGGSEVVVATDAASPYSQSWTPTGVTDGAHTLVARAVRGGQSTDSASITINVGEVLHTLVSSVTCLRAWQSDFGVHNSGSGTCDSWVDQKSSVSWGQVTGTRMPAIISNAIGTHPALRFDGVDDTLVENLNLPAPGTTPTFIWSVFKQLGWGATRFIFASGASGGSSLSILQHTSTPNLCIFNGSFGTDNSGAPISSYVVSEAWFNNAASDYLKVGTTTQTGIAGNTDPPLGWNCGAVLNGSFAANVEVVACLLFSGKPSGAELAALSAAASAMYPGILA